MSKIFFDHLIEIEEVKIHIDKVANSHEEKEDLWNLVDEFINHKIISSILSELDENYHHEFISMFLDKPYDFEIINFLNTKLPLPFEELVNSNMTQVVDELYEILEMIPTKTVKKVKKKKK